MLPKYSCASAPPCSAAFLKDCTALAKSPLRKDVIPSSRSPAKTGVASNDSASTAILKIRIILSLSFSKLPRNYCSGAHKLSQGTPPPVLSKDFMPQRLRKKRASSQERI